MGAGAGGKIKQNIEEDENDARLWDTANSKILNVQMINAIDFYDVTGLAPPSTPIDAKTYENEGLPFFELYKEKTSSIKGNFEGIKGVVETEAMDLGAQGHIHEVGSTHQHSKPMIQNYPEQSINVPVRLLDVDDTIPAFMSINTPDEEWESPT